MLDIVLGYGINAIYKMFTQQNISFLLIIFLFLIIIYLQTKIERLKEFLAGKETAKPTNQVAINIIIDKEELEAINNNEDNTIVEIKINTIPSFESPKVRTVKVPISKADKN